MNMTLKQFATIALMFASCTTSYASELQAKKKYSDVSVSNQEGRVKALEQIYEICETLAHDNTAGRLYKVTGMTNIQFQTDEGQDSFVEARCLFEEVKN